MNSSTIDKRLEAIGEIGVNCGAQFTIGEEMAFWGAVRRGHEPILDQPIASVSNWQRILGSLCLRRLGTLGIESYCFFEIIVIFGTKS
jgi:hypothetical protein